MSPQHSFECAIESVSGAARRVRCVHRLTSAPHARQQDRFRLLSLQSIPAAAFAISASAAHEESSDCGFDASPASDSTNVFGQLGAYDTVSAGIFTQISRALLSLLNECNIRTACRLCFVLSHLRYAHRLQLIQRFNSASRFVGQNTLSLRALSIVSGEMSIMMTRAQCNLDDFQRLPCSNWLG